MKWKEKNLVGIVLFLAANGLYLVLSLRRVFWYDEAYTMGLIQRSFSEILEITSQDVHTPFYYFVLKLFCIFPGGGSLIGGKIFSWLFTILYLLLGAWICRRHYGEKVTNNWLLLSCFMPAMMIQATTARMYTFALFWVTLASYLAYRLYQQESRRKWILFTVATIIAVYIHTFAMLEMVVIYGLLLLLAVVKKRYSFLRKTLLSGMVVSLVYLPWLLVLIKQFSRWAGWESGWHNTIEPFSIHSILEYLAEWFSSMENPNPVEITCSVIFISYAGWLAWRQVRKTRDYLPVMGVLVAGIIVLTAVLISIFIVPCFLGRYIFPLFGGVWLFVAVGMSRMRMWLRRFLMAGILLCGLLTFHEELQLEDQEGLAVYEEVVLDMINDGDIIMADNYFLMMLSIYQPDAQYMLYGGKPEGLPFKNCEAFTQWEQLEDAETIWYLSFTDLKGGNIEEYYECRESREISFSYYDITLEKYVKRR